MVVVCPETSLGGAVKLAEMEFRANRETVLARYTIEPAVKDAIARQDVPFLAERTNAYLLRYYFFATGMKDDEFIKRLNNG